jgi:hypothetical protein
MRSDVAIILNKFDPRTNLHTFRTISDDSERMQICSRIEIIIFDVCLICCKSKVTYNYKV